MTTQSLARYGARNGALTSGLITASYTTSRDTTSRSREEDQALGNIEWAEGQYLAAIRKAVQLVSKERIAATVGDIHGHIEAVLGVPNLEDLLPEEFDNGDF